MVAATLFVRSPEHVPVEMVQSNAIHEAQDARRKWLCHYSRERIPPFDMPCSP